MINSAQGSLTMVGLNTTSPQVFWNGIAVPFVTHIRVDWEADEQHIKLKVSADDVIHAELITAGIIIKRRN